MIRGTGGPYRLQELAALLGGEVRGDPQTEVHRVAALENAAPGAISYLVGERHLQQLLTTRAAAVIVGPAAADATALPRIVCANPAAYFARVSALLNPQVAAVPGCHPSAVIDPHAQVAPDAEIGPLVVIGSGAVIGSRSVIGAGCVIGKQAELGEAVHLHPNVTIYDRCVIGSRVVLHSGVVIGADGFGIVMDDERWLKVPQIGRVIIGNDVEIGANTTVDRGAIDDTVIEEGARLDNLIQIGHNVRIGAHTAIAACVGIAGSTRIGRYCRIGGAAGIGGHLTIADHVEISGYTAITKSISTPGVYSGVYPFEDFRAWRKNAAQVRHLNELARRVKALEEALAGQQRSTN